MTIQLSPAGSGHAAVLDLFSTAAGNATKMAAQAAGQKPQHGERPHQTLATSAGTATVGLIQSAGTTKAEAFAADMAARNEVATGSPNGAAGVQGYHIVENGLANIADGVAVLSGKGRG